jgi:4-amino-4-deoxy-L-arabinose transferase-like glycosyltransferase
MPTLPDRFTRAPFWLVTILAGFTVLATVYSLVTPLFEASDELWHYPMVKYVADHHFGLPVQRPGQTDTEAPWRQEGSQPPLYYLIGAAATFWIDTSDLPDIRRFNPHANIGEVWPDGNANMVVHNAGRESFPWSGTVLAMHIVRLISILMGLGTIYTAYLLGRELFPAAPVIALGAAAFTAFSPMFVFVSAVINNDNLSTLLASVLLLLVVRLIRNADHPPTPRFYAQLGLVAGAGMLAKFQIGFMLPLIALALLIVSIRARDWRPVVMGGIISGGLTILIAGWWYARNYDLYGDATGINVFLDIVGRRAVPADLRQLWTERETFMMSFWGFFGGLNVPMEDSVYTLFNLIAGLSLLGLVYGLIRFLLGGANLSRRSVSSLVRRRRVGPTLPPDGGVPSPSEMERGRVAREASLTRQGDREYTRVLYLARLFALIWPVVVFVSLISWTRQTWASQGRLWFSAIAALNVWLAAGIADWSPGHRPGRVFGVIAAAVVFVGVATTAPFMTIRPAYRLDRNATWSGDTLEVGGYLPVCFREPGSDRDALCMAAQPVAGALLPGDFVRLSPAMTVKGPITRDWSIFVHLVSEDGIIEAQRDVYPGGGLIATSETESGESWNNRIAVRIPKGIYTPQRLDVYIGFYHLPTGERMTMMGTTSRIDQEQNRFYLGQIRLETPPGSVPNPVSVNFGGELSLLGYEVSDRSLPPGQATNITLYWEARHALDTEYVVSIQIIDPDRLSKAAQDDHPPTPPVTQPGEPVSETRELSIATDAAPGRYRLMVRVYPPGDPAHPLRIRTEAGGQSEDFVWLSWIQVEGP